VSQYIKSVSCQTQTDWKFSSETIGSNNTLQRRMQTPLAPMNKQGCRLKSYPLTDRIDNQVKS